MSTAVAFSSPDIYGRHVAIGVAENAIFSTFYNLVSQRKIEGLSKAQVAERMGVGRAVVTKLTSEPTNMKISTMASMANALDADIVFLLVDRHNKYICSSIAVHDRSLFQNAYIVAPYNMLQYPLAHSPTPNFTIQQPITLVGS